MDFTIHAKVVDRKKSGHWTLRSTPKVWIVKFRHWTLRSMPKWWIVKSLGIGLYDPHQSRGSYKVWALDFTIHAKGVDCKVPALDFTIHAKVVDRKKSRHWTLRSTPKLWIVKFQHGLYDPCQSRGS